MNKVKKIRLKEPFRKLLKRISIFLGIILFLFIVYNYQISTFTKMGYSRVSSKYILFHNKSKYIKTVGENKTLNAAFESEFYKEEYLEKYQSIKYVDQKNLIKNINLLIDKGYSISNINMIITHGNDEDVTEFAKRDKVRYIEEFYSVSYAKLRNYDRYVAYSDETGADDEFTVLYINNDLDKEVYEYYEDVTDFNVNMIVNKHRKLGEDFEPNDLAEIPSEYASEDGMIASKIAINAFIKMYKAAKSENMNLVINSSYRSYKEQEELCNYYRNLYGDNYVNKYVAFPGFSEHQTGLAFDIGSRTTPVFKNSKEYKWMLDNAYKYGFILRYDSKYEDITLFRAEPWHFRYVGVDIATKIHEDDMPYEEYYTKFLDE